ncbi:MAG: hydroxyethylthiazole kinase [Lachnospiraceae bacterium]|nr:hydroxyethylthiazole kinase [Lachnospiraceae bacterium]
MLKECLEAVERKMPLIHNITNYVTVNDVANVLLACKASPIMADDLEEAAEITSICDGLTINIGTLNQHTVPAMFAAGKQAVKLGHCVVFDPVGAGASMFRTNTALSLMREISFDCIRGNSSELKALVFGSGNTQGVDANVMDVVTEENLEEMILIFQAFAKERHCILVCTGAIDLVLDERHSYIIRNGRPEMSKITGTGCQLSAVTAAYLAANPERKLEACAAAVCVMGVAGEVAWERMEKGDGNASYRNRIIDAVYRMSGEELERRANYEMR